MFDVKWLMFKFQNKKMKLNTHKTTKWPIVLSSVFASFYHYQPCLIDIY